MPVLLLIAILAFMARPALAESDATRADMFSKMSSAFAANGAQRSALLAGAEERAAMQRLRSLTASLDRLARTGPEDATTFGKELSYIAAVLAQQPQGLPSRDLAEGMLTCLRRQVALGSTTEGCRDPLKTLAAPLDGDASTAASLILPWSIMVAPAASVSGIEPAPEQAEAETQEPEPARSPVRIGFYGQSVDVEIGRLFSLLAERDPELLDPVPYTRTQVIRGCVNRGWSVAIVNSTPWSADREYLALLAASDRAPFRPGGPTRFTLLQDLVPAMAARTGWTGPTDLAEFTSEDALRLITQDVAVRFAITAPTITPLLPALRNLWVVLPDRFLPILSQVVGQELTEPQQVGPALEALELDPLTLWSRIYQAAGRALSCTDANRILESQGLAYRNSDYPLARRTLAALESHTGFPAVPGVTMVASTRRYLEASSQNCAAFGPVENRQLDDPASCNLGQIDVDGEQREIVLAGGAELTFRLTTEERALLSAYLAELEALPRDGDRLRWTSSVSPPVYPQTRGEGPHYMSFALKGVPDPDNWPCLVSLSAAEDLNPVTVRTHIRNYRDRFFPGAGTPTPAETPLILLIDEFDGDRDPSLRNAVGQLPQELASELKGDTAAAPPVLSRPMAANAAEPPPRKDRIERICQLIDAQSRNAEVQRISHGAYITSLLIGRTAMPPDMPGLGLLNPDGAFAEEDFADRVFKYAADNRISLVDEHIGNIADDIERMRHGTEEFDPAASVVNVSLGGTYLFNDQPSSREADQALEGIRVSITRLARDALFVFAAGQPKIDPAQPNARGSRLDLLKPSKVNSKSLECAFVPACLSARPNVVTVGALGPSVGEDGYGHPVLLPWANYGPAVTLAAPGEAVAGRNVVFVDQPGVQRMRMLAATGLRDGTSAAAAFVTALAARMVSAEPSIRATEIKERLVATARPFLTPAGEEQLFAGDEGEVYAGAIDPAAALLDPRNGYVVRADAGDGPDRFTEYVGISTARSVGDQRAFSLFHGTSASERAFFKCDWRDLLRVHIDGAFDEDQNDHPIYKGSVACRADEPDGSPRVARGYFGTRNTQQNECLVREDCWIARTADNREEPLPLSGIRDIYFPTFRQ